MQEQLESPGGIFLQEKVLFHTQTWNAQEMRNVWWIVSWTSLGSPVTTLRMLELYVQVSKREGVIDRDNSDVILGFSQSGIRFKAYTDTGIYT